MYVHLYMVYSVHYSLEGRKIALQANDVCPMFEEARGVFESFHQKPLSSDSSVTMILVLLGMLHHVVPLSMKQSSLLGAKGRVSLTHGSVVQPQREEGSIRGIDFVFFAHSIS